MDKKRTLRLLMSRTVSAVFSFIHSGPEGRNIPDKIRHRIVFSFFNVSAKFSRSVWSIIALYAGAMIDW